jgi:methionine--tRNA ligase beta chain
MITIEDFAKLEFKVGTVISAEEIEGSERLLKLQVDFGPKAQEEVGTTEPVISNESRDSSAAPQNDSGVEMTDEKNSESAEVLQNADDTIEVTDTVKSVEENPNEIRQILSGIKQWYKPAELVGKQFVFITNLAPRKMMGLESQGMIMAAEGEERPSPLMPSEKVPNGSKIR